MTAKEKANELVTKFLRTYKTSLYPPFNKASDEAKQCALIAVQELINDTDASSPFESNGGFAFGLEFGSMSLGTNVD